MRATVFLILIHFQFLSVLHAQDIVLPQSAKSEPKAINTLTPETWYVIECDEPLIVLHSPTDVVRVNVEKGPVRVRGRFADGSGLVETREYTKSNLYFVEAMSSGKCELLIVPVGVQEESAIRRQVLTVSGSGPKPPPDPDPKPDPKPDPLPAKVAHVEILIVEDVRNRTPDTAIVTNAIVGWSPKLDESGHDWKIYDIRTTEPRGKEAVAASAGRTLPVLVLRDFDTKKTLTVEPLPKSLSDLKALVQQYTEVKP